MAKRAGQGKAAGGEVSRAAQDYLKAIYKLQEGGPVQTNALAEHLGVVAPSATNMIARLAEGGLLRHTPYRGVELTENGAAVALEVIRHHRLWEAFLHRALHVPIDQLHEEAERLEHELSDDLEEHMARLLGEPTHDPHGDPIPTRDGSMALSDFPSLATLAVGGKATVRRVPDRDPELLRYIGTLGLLPGAAVELRTREPFNGPLTVRVGPEERVIGHELARRLFVEPSI
jgi:DtxR family transcriptional regulator, Mn-dependent transcriptional regulator